MREVNSTLAALTVEAIGALDVALRAALIDKMIGISTYSADRPISIWLVDTAEDSDAATAQALAKAHDPVGLTVDKLSIAADGVDTATISVSAPKPGAAPVVLLVAGFPVPVTLVQGAGRISMTSNDPAAIPISLQNPANRTTTTLIVVAS